MLCRKPIFFIGMLAAILLTSLSWAAGRGGGGWSFDPADPDGSLSEFYRRYYSTWLDPELDGRGVKSFLIYLGRTGAPERYRSVEACRAAAVRVSRKEFAPLLRRGAQLAGSNGGPEGRDNLIAEWAKFSLEIKEQLEKAREIAIEEDVPGPLTEDQHRLFITLRGELENAPKEDKDTQGMLLLRMLIAPHEKADLQWMLNWLDEQEGEMPTWIWSNVLKAPYLTVDMLLSSKSFNASLPVLYPLVFRENVVLHRKGLLKLIAQAPSPEILAAGILELGKNCQREQYNHLIFSVEMKSVPLVVREAIVRVYARYGEGETTIGIEVLRLPPDEASAKLKLILFDEAREMAPKVPDRMKILDVKKIIENPKEPEEVRAAAAEFWDEHAEEMLPSDYGKTQDEILQEQLQQWEKTRQENLAQVEAFREKERNDESVPKVVIHMAIMAAQARMFGDETRIQQWKLKLIYLKLQEYQEVKGRLPESLDNLKLPAEIDVSEYFYYPMKTLPTNYSPSILVISRTPITYGNGHEVYVVENNELYPMDINEYAKRVAENDKENVPKLDGQMGGLVPILPALVANGTIYEMRKVTYEEIFETSNKSRVELGEEPVPIEPVKKIFDALPDESLFGAFPPREDEMGMPTFLPVADIYPDDPENPFD